MANVKQIGIRQQDGSYLYSLIGVDAADVEVPVAEDTTEPLTDTLAELQSGVASKAVIDHADATTKFGAASASEYGHVKTGTGLTNSNGAISVTYGNAAGTACQGNDGRLSDNRPNPYSLTFGEDTYNGSSAKTITATSIGAAPRSHASTSAAYGAGDANNYGHVKSGTGLTSTSGVLSVNYGSAAGTACQGNDARLSNSRTPVSHASNETTYGIGTSTSYGHVKLNDGYEESGGAASAGVGASSLAVYNAYSALKNSVDGKAPQSHASTGTSYGKGDPNNYGHVKLSDAIDESFDSGDGYAATPLAAKKAYDKAASAYSLAEGKAVKSHASKTTDFGIGTSASYGHLKITDTLSSTATDAALTAAAGKRLNDTLNEKAPNSHASTASTYGLGTIGSYGHVKTINWLSQSVHEDGLALSAYQGFVLDNNKAPNSHASTATTYGKATSSNYGHVRLSDSHTWTSDVDNGVAATPKAVKDAYDLASGKAPGGYGLGTYCKGISNWNDARVTGWYMGYGVANAPDTDWYVGCVIAHNDIFVYQILYPFSHSTAWEDSYVRVCQNGTWSGWKRRPYMTVSGTTLNITL